MLVSSMLLADNRELYLPVVDDHGVDLIVRTKNYDPTQPATAPEHYEFQEIQVKSVLEDGLFAALKCDNPRPNYWFVFYIKKHDLMWLINSEDLCQMANVQGAGVSQNKSGNHVGQYTINLRPTRQIAVKQPQYHITDFTPLP